MYKLDPIERLPDGTLFRLTLGQLRSVRGLAKHCCNFLDGDCLLLDGMIRVNYGNRKWILCEELVVFS